MTRHNAARFERDLRAHGVYKPYVSGDSERMYVESYPLTAIVTNGFDVDAGPLSYVKITDCTLPRIGQDATVTAFPVYLGSPLVQRIAEMLKEFHGAAYARAKEQDSVAAAR